MTANVRSHPRVSLLHASVWMRRLCRSLQMIFPSREHQHGGVALEGSRKDFSTLNSQADAIILDSRERCLWNARALRELVLAQTLKLANDAYGLAY